MRPPVVDRQRTYITIAGWPVGRLAGCLVGWSVHWMVRWFVVGGRGCPPVALLNRQHAISATRLQCFWSAGNVIPFARIPVDKLFDNPEEMAGVETRNTSSTGCRTPSGGIRFGSRA